MSYSAETVRRWQRRNRIGQENCLFAVELAGANNQANSPRYAHSCRHCTFLGCFEEYDLYFCPQTGYPTLLARFGNNGPAYTSGLSSRTPALVEARTRARDCGLLSTTDLPDRDYSLTYVGGTDPNTSETPLKALAPFRGLFWGLLMEFGAVAGLVLLWALWRYVTVRL
jgi:hypothetical protein